jgi:hypothetical protein
VVFERGSSSQETGAVAVYASEDNASGERVVIAAFAFYRLPVDKQFTFINNVVEWLVK